MQPELAQTYWAQLQTFVDRERRRHQVYPPAEQMFQALAATPFARVRVVLLGQDPYHDEGQAHGLSFSVPPSVPPPPSLRNIFRELQADLGGELPAEGCLLPWARQGVLLLNTVLTVRAHQPHSHRGQGWEQFTDAVIRTLSQRRSGVVFLLWGRPAQAKARWIDTTRHVILAAAHPSPLSAHRGFFGSRPFSAANAALAACGQPPIEWRLTGGR
jgi:uracil-DNA glycosylase